MGKIMLLIFILFLSSCQETDKIELKVDTLTIEYGESLEINNCDILSQKICKKDGVNIDVDFKNENGAGKNIPKIGNYEGFVTYKNQKLKFQVIIQDTTSPKFTKTTEEIILNEDESLIIENYFSTDDKSPTKLFLESNSRVEKLEAGIYDMKIVAKDYYGNVAKQSFLLNVVAVNAEEKVLQKITNNLGCDNSVAFAIYASSFYQETNYSREELFYKVFNKEEVKKKDGTPFTFGLIGPQNAIVMNGICKFEEISAN